MWVDILKAKGDVTLNFILKHGMTKDFQSPDEIIARLKRTGKATGGRINTGGLSFRLKKLRKRGLIESKEEFITEEDRRRQILTWRLTNSEVVKGEWRTIVDGLVNKDTPFEKIYEHLANELKFHTPSKREVGQYLSENFQRHKLWANLWSNKEE
tara:strand:+ start:1029 stop:1493 length:465 start_codon:yes stop_codon:yes gene_type:complete